MFAPAGCRLQTNMDPVSAVGCGSCYYKTDNIGYCDAGSSSNIFRDGSMLQVQPMQDQYPMVFQIFMSDSNIRYLQKQIHQQGFNPPPDGSTLRDFMDGVYIDDMPYGAYNQLDPTRQMGNQPGSNPATLQYVNYYVDRLNRQVLNRVCRNMAQMRESQRLYLKDLKMSGTRGVFEIDQPVSTMCTTRGDQLRLDFLLPNTYADRNKPIWHEPTKTWIPA